MSEYRRRLMAMQGGDRFPWIESDAGMNFIQFSPASDCVARCWDMYTGEEFNPKTPIQIHPNGRKIKLGIEWKDLAEYDLSGGSLSWAADISPYFLSQIADRITSVSQLFYMNNRLKKLPDDFLKGLGPYVDFRSCFAFASELLYTPKVDGLELWEAYPYANGQGCFYYCTQLPNWNDIPYEWKEYL